MKKMVKMAWCKIPTFVSSGSSANYISISILKALNKKINRSNVPSLTWVSDKIQFS